MKYFVTAVVLAAGMQTGAALAQDAATAACAEYAAMDNAGKMAIVAELESMNSELESPQQMSSVEIQATLDANCTEDPDLLIVDAWKELRK